jgi:hypothetical protein
LQDLEKQQVIANEKISKLVQLGTNLVENIIEPAAKKGNVDAIQALGECYQHGLGGKKKDEKQAIEYYEKGVSANSPASQCSLGTILIEQRNDVKANERGVELFKKSSAAEYPEGQLDFRGILMSLLFKLSNFGRMLLKAVMPCPSTNWVTVVRTVFMVSRKTPSKLRNGI